MGTVNLGVAVQGEVVVCYRAVGVVNGLFGVERDGTGVVPNGFRVTFILGLVIALWFCPLNCWSATIPSCHTITPRQK